MGHTLTHVIHLLLTLVAIWGINRSFRTIISQAKLNLKMSEIGMDVAKAIGNRFDLIEGTMLKILNTAKARSEENEAIERNPRSN